MACRARSAPPLVARTEGCDTDHERQGKNRCDRWAIAAPRVVGRGRFRYGVIGITTRSPCGCYQAVSVPCSIRPWNVEKGTGVAASPTCDLWHVRVVVLMMQKQVEANHGIPGRNQS